MVYRPRPMRLFSTLRRKAPILALSLLLPGLARVKEWAYAGVVFQMTGATVSHLLVGLIGFAAGIYVLVNHTRTGMLIRAGASNREMVGALGVDIKLLFAAVFTLGSVLAGLAGMLIAPITEASIGMGNEIIITAFVVVIIGGIGSIKGAFVAAMLIGMIDTFGRAFLDHFFALFMSVDAAETAAPAIRM